MKHINQSLVLTRWLSQFDACEVITKLFDLHDSTAYYIVNPENRVMLWSKGAEQLSSIKQGEIVGRICPEEYWIEPNQSGHVIFKEMEVFRPNEGALKFKQYSRALFNKTGEYSGGVGLLLAKPTITDRDIKVVTRVATEDHNFHGILSRCPKMEPVFQIIENAAKTEATVLVRGESGSGKELVARAIHDLSTRWSQPFLAINCAALSLNLLESELFGHVRGAFSGAIRDHAGLFQRANGGTLFLDEVAELPQELQAKLLRVLQERNYIPVGGDHTIDVDVRIVAATHRSLREEVKKGQFREDLMYRLRVIPIFIPPLRERREDINLLLWHFIQKHNLNGYRRIERIDPQAMRVLLDYPWPGNIRELQNVLEYAYAVGSGAVLHLSELPPEFREASIQDTVCTEVVMSADEEASAIRNALQQSNGKVNRAAGLLGMSRATFWRKRKLYEL